VLVALQAVLWLAAIAIAVRRRSQPRPRGSRDRHPSARVPVEAASTPADHEVIDLTEHPFVQSAET
jgi:hypothetical protein